MATINRTIINKGRVKAREKRALQASADRLKDTIDIAKAKLVDVKQDLKQYKPVKRSK